VSIAYKQVSDSPEGFTILAREIDDGQGVVWEEWNSGDKQWARSEWACDAFHGFDDFAVNNVKDISEKEALEILRKAS
jgi:hypothetical protein